MITSGLPQMWRTLVSKGDDWPSAGRGELQVAPLHRAVEGEFRGQGGTRRAVAVQSDPAAERFHAVRRADQAGARGQFLVISPVRARGGWRSSGREILADTYQATAALATLGDGDAAWIAADRAAFISEAIGSSLTLGVSLSEWRTSF